MLFEGYRFKNARKYRSKGQYLTFKDFLAFLKERKISIKDWQLLGVSNDEVAFFKKKRRVPADYWHLIWGLDNHLKKREITAGKCRKRMYEVIRKSEKVSYKKKKTYTMNAEIIPDKEDIIKYEEKVRCEIMKKSNTLFLIVTGQLDGSIIERDVLKSEIKDLQGIHDTLAKITRNKNTITGKDKSLASDLIQSFMAMASTSIGSKGSMPTLVGKTENGS